MKLSENDDLARKIAAINHSTYFISLGLKDMVFEAKPEQEARLQEQVDEIIDKLERFRKNLQLLIETELDRIDTEDE